MFYFEHLCFLFVSAGRIICVNVKYPADDCCQIPHLTAHSRKAAQRLLQPLLQQSMENQHYQSYYCLITRAFYVIQMSWEIKRRSKMIFVFHVLQTGFNGHYEDFCYFHFLLVAQRHWCNYHVVWVTASSFDSVRDWTFAITHLALRQPIQHCDTSILKMHITICRKSPQMTGKSHLDNRIFWGKQKKNKKNNPLHPRIPTQNSPVPFCPRLLRFWWRKRWDQTRTTLEKLRSRSPGIWKHRHHHVTLISVYSSFLTLVILCLHLHVSWPLSSWLHFQTVGSGKGWFWGEASQLNLDSWHTDRMFFFKF